MHLQVKFPHAFHHSHLTYEKFVIQYEAKRLWPQAPCLVGSCQTKSCFLSRQIFTFPLLSALFNLILIQKF